MLCPSSRGLCRCLCRLVALGMPGTGVASLPAGGDSLLARPLGLSTTTTAMINATSVMVCAERPVHTGTTHTVGELGNSSPPFHPSFGHRLGQIGVFH